MCCTFPTGPRASISRRWSAVLVLLVGGMLGCNDTPPIREYVVAKPPAPGSVWFFKLIGPEAAVASARPQLVALVETVKFDERTGRPTWQLPEGWKEESAANSVRYKTLKLPGGEGLEVAVTQIGGQVPLSRDDLRMQSNLLREQVGLPARDGSTAAADPPESEERTLAVGPWTGRLFDYSGETQRYGKTRLLTAMVAIATPPTAGETTEDGRTLPFTFTAPAEWQSAPPKQFSLVTMAAGHGEETASMTITPAMGGVLANINRWRSQAGLEAFTEEQLVEHLDPIEVGGLTILYAEMLGEERSILGGIAPIGSGTWFVKLDGPPSVVNDERERFRKFLESFRAVQ